MDKKIFQIICKRALLLIRFICDRIEIIGTLEFTWTDLFLKTPSLLLMIFMQHLTWYNSYRLLPYFVFLPNLGGTCSAEQTKIQHQPFI